MRHLMCHIEHIVLDIVIIINLLLLLMIIIDI